MTIMAVETPRINSHLGTLLWYLSIATENIKAVDSRIYKEVDQNEWIVNKLIGNIALMIIQNAPNIPDTCVNRSMMICTLLSSIFHTDKPRKNTISNNAVEMIPIL